MGKKKAKKPKTNDGAPKEDANYSLLMDLPHHQVSSSSLTTTSRSTLGLLPHKVFDPTRSPVLAQGFFPFTFLSAIQNLLRKMSLDNSKVLKTEPLDPAKAKWTRLVLSTYRDPQGKVRGWEHAERSHRPKSSTVDGVGIVAIIEKETGPELVLQKQYRPPIDSVVIEVPAGLVDEGETAEEAAIRELKEETGYIGVLSESTPVMFNDPGFCNTNLKMVHVSIDMSNPLNQKPVPELEENEFIEVFTLPLKDLWESCKKFEAEGYAIDARVGSLAEGIELARTMNLFLKQSNGTV